MGHTLDGSSIGFKKRNWTAQGVEIEPIKESNPWKKKLKATNEMCIDSPITNAIVITEEYLNLSSHLGSMSAFEHVDRT